MKPRLTRLLWPTGWVERSEGPFHRASQWLRWPWRPRFTAAHIAMAERHAEEVWLNMHGAKADWIDAAWSLREAGE